MTHWITSLSRDSLHAFGAYGHARPAVREMVKDVSPPCRQPGMSGIADKVCRQGNTPLPGKVV
jgi:hypothetical protein